MGGAEMRRPRPVLFATWTVRSFNEAVTKRRRRRGTTCVAGLDESHYRWLLVPPLAATFIPDALGNCSTGSLN